MKCENQYDAIEIVTQAIESYCTAFKDLIHGRNDDLEQAEYTGGSQIYQVFKCFANVRIEKLDPFDTITDEVMIREMRRSLGINPGLFIPEEACRNLIRYSINKFKEPCFK